MGGGDRERSSGLLMGIPSCQQSGAKDESQTAPLANEEIYHHSISQHDPHTQEDLSHCVSHSKSTVITTVPVKKKSNPQTKDEANQKRANTHSRQQC